MQRPHTNSGIAALFCGTSGTGQTLGAALAARAPGLEGGVAIGALDLRHEGIGPS